MLLRNYFFVFLAGTLLSCHNYKEGATTFESSYNESVSSYGENDLAKSANFNSQSVDDDIEEPNSIERKLIKTADIRFEVQDLPSSVNEIQNIALQKKGIVVNSNFENNSYRISQSITIRVPNTSFDTLVESISEKAVELDSKIINSQDVTEQFVDVTARLNAKKQIESRYLTILEKASSIADILEIEKKLGEIREEIEATEGRLRYLQNQVSLSTINVFIYQKLEATSNSLSPTFFEKFGKGLKNGWQYFLDFLIGLSYSWPFILLGIAIILLLRRWLAKRKAKKENN